MVWWGGEMKRQIRSVLGTHGLGFLFGSPSLSLPI